MINTYIINLKTSSARKQYMEQLLASFSNLNIEFIEAVDGRMLSDEKQNEAFDMDKCIKRYGRIINRGEVGCTLSHRQCYKKLIKSSDEYALILEDDISIVSNTDSAFNDKITAFMRSKKPKILFLSGDYWYWNKTNPVRVFSAVGSYAYFINASAAKKILSVEKPFNVADDWSLYKGLGVSLYAIHPYIIDANIINIPSDIQQKHWGNMKKLMSRKNILYSYYYGALKRLLYLCGHFESKIRNE